MSVWQRVLAYVAALGVVLAAGLGIGRWVGPIESAGEPAHADTHCADHAMDPTDEHAHEHPTQGYRMVVADPVLAARRTRLAFTILDEAGAPLTSYDVQHEKRLHLVLVSNDLARYRHVHPVLDPSTGAWTVPVSLDPGAWNAYADFVPSGGEETVLRSGLSVAGDYRPVELGADRFVSRVDGYEAHLERDGATLTVHVVRDGRDVTDLQPYLGAYGHLVAISTADLGYLHVHPEDGDPGPEISFHAELTEAGRYRLFLDFRHDGRLHTADFTITVDQAPSDGGMAGHDH